jgi:biopolymer transport protein ExbB/TolQ
VGLVAAIPAQVFFNYFTARIRVLATERGLTMYTALRDI